jgi:hypothetical protein
MKQVMLDTSDRAGRAAPDEAAAWAMMFAVGAALLMIGVTDLAMLFYPARFASIDWEFGTISGFIDGLPVTTIGFSAMVVAATARGWMKWRRLLGVLALLMAMTVLVLVAIFIMDAPAAFRAVNPAMKQSLGKAIIKSVSMGVIYVCLFATQGVWTWQRLKKS